MRVILTLPDDVVEDMDKKRAEFGYTSANLFSIVYEDKTFWGLPESELEQSASNYSDEADHTVTTYIHRVWKCFAESVQIVRKHVIRRIIKQL